VQANYDNVLKPEMSKNMGEFLPNLTRGEVDASHWALTQKPEEVNAIVRNWLEKQGFTVKSSL
jgi:soluble epoxide hydrolase/lipid-phosphate phosphatase